jgi:hypothetical protein
MNADKKSEDQIDPVTPELIEEVARRIVDR